jgi:hypothetical protein
MSIAKAREVHISTASWGQTHHKGVEIPGGEDASDAFGEDTGFQTKRKLAYLPAYGMLFMDNLTRDRHCSFASADALCVISFRCQALAEVQRHVDVRGAIENGPKGCVEPQGRVYRNQVGSCFLFCNAVMLLNVGTH